MWPMGSGTQGGILPRRGGRSEPGDPMGQERWHTCCGLAGRAMKPSVVGWHAGVRGGPQQESCAGSPREAATKGSSSLALAFPVSQAKEGALCPFLGTRTMPDT